jgi:hypothetical protein
MVGDFHTLDRFGELVFADASGKLPGPRLPTLPMSPRGGLAAQLAAKAAGNAPAPVSAPEHKVPAAKRVPAARAGDQK